MSLSPVQPCTYLLEHRQPLLRAPRSGISRLRRRRLAPQYLVHVEKEANKLDDRGTGGLSALDEEEMQVVYPCFSAEWQYEAPP